MLVFKMTWLFYKAYFWLMDDFGLLNFIFLIILILPILLSKIVKLSFFKYERGENSNYGSSLKADLFIEVFYK